LATLKFGAIADPRARTQEDAEGAANAKLGIAFVATALGKKIPRVASGQIISGMTECHVELEAPRKRSQTPTLTAPPNSVEAADPGSDVRFSQSDVIIGYPADVEEIGADFGAAKLMPNPAGCPETLMTGAVLTIAVVGVGAEVRTDTTTINLGGVASFSCAIPEVPVREEVDEAPAAPNEVPTPVIGTTIVRETASDVQGPVQTPKSTEIVPGFVEDDIARKIRYDHKQKLIREIAASQLLREELAKNNPNLVMAASFLSQVSGTDAGYRKLKETAGAKIWKRLEDAEACARSGGADGDISIATNTGDLTDTGNAEIVSVAIVHVETAKLLAVVTIAIDRLNPGSDAIDLLSPDGDATDAVSVADSVMSVGSSSSDGDQSRSTCRSSVSASGNRKRVAEESPERECGDSSRREFPGRVTRSAAGCRVYIPPATGDESELPERTLNDDGLVVEKARMLQGHTTMVNEGGKIVGTELGNMGVSDNRDKIDGGHDVTGSTIPPTPLPLSFPVTSTPDSVPHVVTMARRLPELVEMPVLAIAHVRDTDVATRLPSEPTAIADALVVRVVVTEDEFGRDTCVVEEICQMIEGMSRSWSAYRAFEAATARFPNIDCAALRLTTMAVLMGQRRCINRMTNAGVQSGPRRDEDGAIYLELNSACADEYRNSY